MSGLLACQLSSKSINVLEKTVLNFHKEFFDTYFCLKSPSDFKHQAQLQKWKYVGRNNGENSNI